jgi:hypothetical protein
MTRVAAGAGPQTMVDIRRFASELAARLETDPAVLVWMTANAMPLIGQQLLVAAVQAVADPARAFAAALEQCRRELGTRADAATVSSRLMENHPGAVRAWLVKEQLPRLIADRLDDKDGRQTEAP